MDINMLTMRDDVAKVAAKHESSWEDHPTAPGHGRYALTYFEAAHAVADETGWTDAYADLVAQFAGVWGYASFDRWCEQFASAYKE